MGGQKAIAEVDENVRVIAEDKAAEEANAAEETTAAEMKAMDNAKADVTKAVDEPEVAVAEAAEEVSAVVKEVPAVSTEDVSPTSADEAATLNWLAEMGDELAEMDEAPPR